jgi:hypothetical protein
VGQWSLAACRVEPIDRRAVRSKLKLRHLCTTIEQRQHREEQNAGLMPGATLGLADDVAKL